MSYVTASPADDGPPPPPPPIYADKTKGSKRTQGSTLAVSIQRCDTLAPEYAQEGAILWLLGPSGTWSKGIVSRDAFTDDGSDEVELLVSTTIVPEAISLQPQRQAWAQQLVDLEQPDITCVALASVST